MGSRGTGGQGDKEELLIPYALCPMTAGALCRGTRPPHCLPNAHCPFPNAQSWQI
ncbi:hypothetical protein PI95_007660 [Hassallia byssoidea VB512170]|uniref:Uncharacterized protein n=1 Tax=Hassallia byssoidea VB512170 TaxID=1304833 RepID=A0A846H5U1_9CYAN|nr:hypothetical protein [Hassalia byssoidea]NEU72453.1 hypothetical protein [Hassalia byssoidea VB512170]